jgi:hypothetical protein
MRELNRGTMPTGAAPTMTSVFAAAVRPVIEEHSCMKLKERVGFSTELPPALLKGNVDAVVMLSSVARPHGLAFTPSFSLGHS